MDCFDQLCAKYYQIDYTQMNSSFFLLKVLRRVTELETVVK